MLSQVSVFSLVLAGLIGLIIGLLICRIIVGKTGKQNTTLPKELLQEGYNEGARLWLSSDKKQLVTEMEGAFFREYGELNAVQQAKAENLLLLWKPHKRPAIYQVNAQLLMKRLQKKPHYY